MKHRKSNDSSVVGHWPDHDGQHVFLTISAYINLFLLGSTILVCCVGVTSFSRKRDRAHTKKGRHKPASTDNEKVSKVEQSQGHHDGNSSGNLHDSGTHHHTDPKSDEDQEEGTSQSSQKPPRPGTKSVRKKRKRNERARKREERERLAEKSRKRRMSFSLYQFIKEEVFRMRRHRQIRRRRPKRVERGPVFRPVRRPIPSPPKHTFCMRPKKKKKSHMHKYETSTVEDEMFQMRMRDRFKAPPKSYREFDTPRPKKSPPSVSSGSRSTNLPSESSDRMFDNALKTLAQEEGITNEEYADLYETESALSGTANPSGQRSRREEALRKQLLQRLKKLTEGNASSTGSIHSESSNAAKQVDEENVLKPPIEIVDATKKFPAINDEKNCAPGQQS